MYWHKHWFLWCFLLFYIRVYLAAARGGALGRRVRSGHGLPKVLPRPAMLDPSTPCGRATGWPTCRAGDLRLSSTLSDTPRRTPMVARLLGKARGAVAPHFMAFLRLLIPAASIGGRRGVPKGVEDRQGVEWVRHGWPG
jgi:hypothetical protein